MDRAEVQRGAQSRGPRDAGPVAVAVVVVHAAQELAQRRVGRRLARRDKRGRRVAEIAEVGGSRRAEGLERLDRR